MKLDYSITETEQRIKYINNLLEEREHWSSRDLQKMADYIIFAESENNREILSDNRMVTINRRETSFQGLSERLEGGEDALHGLMRSDKQMILTPKNSITQEDLDSIPELARLRERILEWEIKLESAKGKHKFGIKKMLIEMRKEQYAIKQLYKTPMYSRTTARVKTLNSTVEDLRLDNAEHISEILNNYIKLKQTLWEDLHNDMRWTLVDLEDLIEKYLRFQYPIYYDILTMKVDGDSNEEIQAHLEWRYNKQHSQEYISSLWRNKIPEIIADGYKEDYLNWFYTFKARGIYKTCSRCKTPKLAHKRYFSTNQAAKYGFYSVCKECRNK